MSAQKMERYTRSDFSTNGGKCSQAPMRILIAILASATLLSAQTMPYAPKQSDRPEVLTADEPGFQPIFDGKTLAGWE